MGIYTKDEWMKNSKSLHVMKVDSQSAKAHEAPHSDGVTVLKFTIKAGEEVSALNRPVPEISPIGRSTPLYAPLVLPG